jgi:hypothetical protein
MTTEARTAVAQPDPAKNISLPCGPAHVACPVPPATAKPAAIPARWLISSDTHRAGIRQGDHHAPEPSDTRQRTPGSATRTSSGGDGEPTARAGCPTPGTAPGEDGRLVPRRAAAVSVVPAPPDGSGDEPRDPPNGRATGTLDIRRPPPLNPRQNPAATSQQEPATRPRPAATMSCRRPQPDRCTARPGAHPPAPAQIHTVITGDMPAAERDRRCLVPGRGRHHGPSQPARPPSPVTASGTLSTAKTDKTDSRHEARVLARCYFTALVIHIT